MEKNKDIYSIKVDGQPGLELNWRNLALDIFKQSERAISFRKNDKTYHVELMNICSYSKKMKLRVNGQIHQIEINDHLDRLIQEMGLEISDARASKDILAPMPGQVKDIHVKQGTEVSKGDPVLVLVAMKMENLIKSPLDGVVKEVLTTEDSIVNKNDLLISFE